MKEGENGSNKRFKSEDSEKKPQSLQELSEPKERPEAKPPLIVPNAALLAALARSKVTKN